MSNQNRHPAKTPGGKGGRYAPGEQANQLSPSQLPQTGWTIRERFAKDPSSPAGVHLDVLDRWRIACQRLVETKGYQDFVHQRKSIAKQQKNKTQEAIGAAQTGLKSQNRADSNPPEYMELKSKALEMIGTKEAQHFVQEYRQAKPKLGLRISKDAEDWALLLSQQLNSHRSQE